VGGGEKSRKGKGKPEKAKLGNLAQMKSIRGEKREDLGWAWKIWISRPYSFGNSGI